MATSSVISTVVVGAILLLIVVLIIRHMYKKKKAGIGACGCDCASCGGSCGQTHEDTSK
ncbi:MAG: FeoB-associated Cys-rich membrane protein [Suipraeoptans sp.]